MSLFPPTYDGTANGLRVDLMQKIAAPFDLHYVEVGNEDQFDTSGSYNAYRFPMFYDAIKAATAISPATSRLGSLGTSFRRTFPANSLTVLTLPRADRTRNLLAGRPGSGRPARSTPRTLGVTHSAR